MQDKLLRPFSYRLEPSPFPHLPVNLDFTIYFRVENFLKHLFCSLAAVGQVQQIVSGGQVLQILSASPNPTAPQVSNTSPAVVRHPVASARPKQPQLRPKPANSAASSPTPAQQATSVRYLPIACILFDCIISNKVLFFTII